MTQRPSLDAASPAASRTVDVSPPAEPHLTQFGAQLLHLVGLSPVAMCLCNPDGTVAYHNAAAAELWRWTQPTPGWFTVAGGAADPLASVLAGGPPVRDLELALVRADGSRFIARLRIEAVSGAAGGIAGAALTAEPRTDERMLVASATGRLGLWDWDIVHDQISWTESLYAIHGVSPENFQPSLTGFTALVHPEDVARVTARVQAALDGTQPFELELRILRPDGETVWLFTNATVAREGGRPVRMVGATFDITERKRAELRLLESEERFRALAQHAPVGIFQTDPNGSCIFVNDYWSRMAGMSPRQALGAGWTQALFPGDRDRVLEAWEVARRERKPLAIEHRLIGAHDALLWVQASAVEVRDAAGASLGFIGTAIDVTERKAADFALRESEKRFRVVASRAPVGIFMTDPLGQNIYVNAAWCNLAGLAPPEACGDGWLGAIHPDDRERVRDGWAAAVLGGLSSKTEYRFLKPDGSITWVSGTAVQLRDATGRLTGYIGTIADFTERKQAELALRESEEKLRRAQEELLAHASDLERKVEARTASLREAIVQMEEFSYSVSHDLRAPLRAMNGYAEVLLEDYGARLDDLGRDYLRRILRSSERMEKMTHDVLTYSRIARADVVPATVDVAAVVRDLVTQFSELQQGKAELVMEEPLLPVTGHELSLSQCLGNLLTNAVKFVPPGVKPRIRVFTTRCGPWVRLWVEDNGIGVAPELQSKLFQVFERLPTATPYEGTGIGLAIVRKAVERMGGRYGVESDGRQGSRFWIELPGVGP